MAGGDGADVRDHQAMADNVTALTERIEQKLTGDAEEHRASGQVLIFDTTLRDGEQSPGIALDVDDKLTIATQLARLGVDVIEAGFPVASQGDFLAVATIAEMVGLADGPVIAALCRTGLADIDRAYEAIAAARRGRLHVFIATSEIHMAKKLRMTREQVLCEITSGVGRARSLCADVEFSPEDGYRSDRVFLMEALRRAVDAGATTLNIPDTVGFATPGDYGSLIAQVRAEVPGDYVISTHCHDDLGLAVANSLAGVLNGAGQVECSVNGIGERAGNAALEEVVMAIHTRPDTYAGRHTTVNTRELMRTSELVSELTGYPVQFNKAVVGKNAFAHESGIHQHGVLADRSTYEVIDAAAVGQQAAQIVLGKHSGRHAFAAALQELGVKLVGDGLNSAFARFKELADRKAEITTADLLALSSETADAVSDAWALLDLDFAGGAVPSATVTLQGADGRIVAETRTGAGVVDAASSAICAVTGFAGELVEYRVEAVTEGLDALAFVTVMLRWDQVSAAGRGVANDVVEASARAYLGAVNRVMHLRQALGA